MGLVRRVHCLRFALPVVAGELFSSDRCGMARISMLSRRSAKRRGVLTLEWILLSTLLVIGIIGGLGAVRYATLTELGQLAQAISNLIP